jgi:hypothetical protein
LNIDSKSNPNSIFKSLEGEKWYMKAYQEVLNRKNIGRALLNMTSDPYLKIWEIDMHRSENAIDYGHLVNEGLEAALEAKISEYLRNNITFVCFPVDEKTERIRLEEGYMCYYSFSNIFNTFDVFEVGNSVFEVFSPVFPFGFACSSCDAVRRWQKF